MTNEQMIALKEHRIKLLKENGKNVDSMGCIRRLQREIRNLKRR